MKDMGTTHHITYTSFMTIQDIFINVVYKGLTYSQQRVNISQVVVNKGLTFYLL